MMNLLILVVTRYLPVSTLTLLSWFSHVSIFFHLLEAVIAAQIEQKLQVKVEAGTFTTACTVRSLSKLVEYQLQIGNLIIEPSVKGKSELILIQQGTSRYPLFFVHPVGGTVYIYKFLSESLGSKYTVYGLQAHGLRVGDTPLDDISEMSTNYIKCIRSVQPQGPYHIGGMSFGGLVAFEMAHQLADAEEKVDLLALFDAPNPLEHIDLLAKDEIFKRSLFYVFGGKYDFPDEIKDATLEEKLEYMRQTGKVPTSLDAVAIQQYITVWSTHHAAKDKYIPRHFKGRLQFFNATVQNEMYPCVAEDAWSDYAAEVVTVRVPGDHVSMLMYPHVTVLAEKLLSLLKF